MFQRMNSPSTTFYATFGKGGNFMILSMKNMGSLREPMMIINVKIAPMVKVILLRRLHEG